MDKQFFKQYWPYLMIAVVGLVLTVLRFAQGSWQTGLIWLAASSYWGYKLYKTYEQHSKK